MKQKRQNRLVCRMLSMAIILVISLGISITAFATSSANIAVTDDRAGVMCIEYGIVVDNKFTPISTGSSFLINSDTLLTCYHVVHLTDPDQVKAMRELYGEKWESKMAIRAILANGSEVGVTEKVANEKVDYSVLLLNQDIHDHAYLALRETPVATSEQIFALGFPYVVSDLTEGTATKFTAEDVSVTSGTISKGDAMVNGMHYVQHNAILKGGNSGGPLVDSEGVVVGINSAVDSDTGDYGYAIAIDQVILTLKGLGIPYTSASDTSAENKGSDVNVVNKDGAETEVKETEAPETTAPETAAPETEPATQPAAANVLETAEAQSASQGMNLILIGGIVAAVAVVVIILLVLLLGRKKNQNQDTPGVGGGGYVSPADDAKTDPFKPVNDKPVVGSGHAYDDNSEVGTGVLGGDGGETGVLFGEAGDTTMLSRQPYAILKRKGTGEEVRINDENFVIGRERRKVKYCINDNTDVSRTHAKIVKKGSRVCVIDLGSKNGTYVNDVKCATSEPVELKTGDKLVLADVEFTVELV